ncbi:callose synthase 7-like [Pyrus communis]|uniref:callose synthase 7-like n=1 Tax=Pyrus communis TaxID=23211 RepID=UPI0035C16CE9
MGSTRLQLPMSRICSELSDPSFDEFHDPIKTSPSITLVKATLPRISQFLPTHRLNFFWMVGDRPYLSHFVEGLELLILLIVYGVYGESHRSSNLFRFIIFSMWFLVASWLFAPFIFNPSNFDWQKIVDDWTDWKRWMGNRGRIGISLEKSWESWWYEEQEHLKYTDFQGRILEIVLALRFLIYQYGIVYHLDIAHHSKSLLVYGLSWVVMVTVLFVLMFACFHPIVSMGGRRFGTDFQLSFRILKALLFLGFMSVMTFLFVVCGLTISDLFAAIPAFLPTGWALHFRSIYPVKIPLNHSN